MIRFITDHPYVFGVTLALIGLWALVYVLWWRAMGADYTADPEDRL